MVKKVAAVFVAVVFGVLLTGGTAWAQDGGRQNFTLLSVNTDTTTVIASGVVNARGVEEEIEVEFAEDGELTVVTSFVFEDGTVFVTIEGTSEFSFNERSCVGRFGATGDYVITGGTDDFAGANGGGTATASGTFVAGRNADGSCSEDEEDEVFGVFIANLRGDIAFVEAEAA